MSEQAKTSATQDQTSAVAPASELRPRRWEPTSLMEDMQADLARLFELGPFGVLPLGRALSRMPQISTAGMPRADVFEREGKLIVKAELPGVKKDDIDLAVEDGDLVLRAERKEEREVKDENWHRMERSYGSLYRRLPLPEGVQTDQITAALSDGVLEITVPKPLAKEAQSQKIAISAGQGGK